MKIQTILEADAPTRNVRVNRHTFKYPVGTDKYKMSMISSTKIPGMLSIGFRITVPSEVGPTWARATARTLVSSIMSQDVAEGAHVDAAVQILPKPRPEVLSELYAALKSSPELGNGWFFRLTNDTINMGTADWLSSTHEEASV